MKHVKLFEDWGDQIDRSRPQIILIQISHYLTQERERGRYTNLEEATSDFLRHFSEFVTKEWGGSPKRYFEGFNPNVQNVNTWNDFFLQFSEKDMGETTFYVEIIHPQETTKVLKEVDLLSKIHKSDPSYLQSQLPFTGKA